MNLTNDISQPEIRVILDYWLSKRGTNVVPTVKAIDPSEISPALLPWLFLFRREESGRYRCSLAGTGIVRINGSDPTGRYLDDASQEGNEGERPDLFDHVVNTAMPRCYRGRWRVSRESERGFTRLLLPVSNTDGVIDHVFGIVRFGPVDPVGMRRKALSGRMPSVTVRGKALPGFGEAVPA